MYEAGFNKKMIIFSVSTPLTLANPSIFYTFTVKLRIANTFLDNNRA